MTADDFFYTYPTTEEQIVAFFKHYFISMRGFSEEIQMDYRTFYRTIHHGKRKHPLKQSLLDKINAYYGTEFKLQEPTPHNPPSGKNGQDENISPGDGNAGD